MHYEYKNDRTACKCPLRRCREYRASGCNGLIFRMQTFCNPSGDGVASQRFRRMRPCGTFCGIFHILRHE